MAARRDTGASSVRAEKAEQDAFDARQKAASQCDLETYLRGGEDNLELRLSNWFTKHAGAGIPLVLNVRWRYLQSGAAEKLNAEPIIIERAETASSKHIVDVVEQLILDKCGSTPIGQIRCQGYVDGNSNKNTLDFSRVLVPELAAGLVDPNLQFVLRMYDKMDRQYSAFQGTVQAAMQQQSVVIQELVRTVGTLAAVRTPATAASDMQTGLTFLALIALVAGAPYIKRAIGVRETAGIDEVVAALKKSWNGANAAVLENIKIPESAKAPQLTDAGDDQAATDDQAAPADGQAPAAIAEIDVSARLDTILDALTRNPELRDRAFKKAMKIPELQQAAETAYFAHAAGG